MNSLLNQENKNVEYTGRNIAILTDVHGMLEPLEAALKDIANQDITEIYSLGDNIGDGPNPLEVMQLLEQYNVISIAGNAEEYIKLGIEPFLSYFNYNKMQNSIWTKEQLTGRELGIIDLLPHSIELILGGKKLALCHFANDVRIDFMERSTWGYQKGFNAMVDGSRIEGYENISDQFRYTNSSYQLKEIKNHLTSSKHDRGYVSVNQDPMFGGKTVDDFDAIIQGHVHWKLRDPGRNGSPDFYSIRALGMGYRPLEYPYKSQEQVNSEASYVIIRELTNGFTEPEERLVRYDREKMVYSILKCDNPYSPIKKFASISEEEINKFNVK